MMAHFTSDSAYAVMQAVEQIEQPLTINGHPVTFWHYLDGQPGPYSRNSRIGELGAHCCASCISSPRRRTCTGPNSASSTPSNRGWRSPPISDSDKTFLLDRLKQLRAEVDELTYELPSYAVHGDAHIKNLMISDGTAIFIDFERFSYGQPEWGLGVTATERCTAQWWSAEQYQAFTDAYGFDVTQWSGFSTVQAVHQLKMATWLMQNINEGADIAAEFDSRMRTIRDGVSSE